MSVTPMHASLVSPAAGQPPQAAQAALPAHQPRSLRVAASFCRNRVEALRLMALLASHPRLQERQLALLSPADAAAERFAACRQQWDCLRPPHAAQDNPHAPVPPALTGATMGAIVGLLLGTVQVRLEDVIALTLLAAGVGMLIAMLVQRSIGASDKHRCFDQRLQRRLAQGCHAVVVVGVHDDSLSQHVLQAMRQGGMAWCAEAPLRRA